MARRRAYRETELERCLMEGCAEVLPRPSPGYGSLDYCDEHREECHQRYLAIREKRMASRRKLKNDAVNAHYIPDADWRDLRTRYRLVLM